MLELLERPAPTPEVAPLRRDGVAGNGRLTAGAAIAALAVSAAGSWG